MKLPLQSAEVTNYSHFTQPLSAEIFPQACYCKRLTSSPPCYLFCLVNQQYVNTQIVCTCPPRGMDE
jgi:hypothetical protein